MFHQPSGEPLLWDAKGHALKARHILRYIFPRQHGLSHPFKLTSLGDTYEYKNYMDREDEIEVRVKSFSLSIVFMPFIYISEGYKAF